MFPLNAGKYLQIDMIAADSKTTWTAQTIKTEAARSSETQVTLRHTLECFNLQQ